ncbi:MAG TPA: hypothetical protein VFQ61_15235 [Polyangiaceae bacterium]|nr:hypothetical protein [Polyangiaceae bacterium]
MAPSHLLPRGFRRLPGHAPPGCPLLALVLLVASQAHAEQGPTLVYANTSTSECGTLWVGHSGLRRDPRDSHFERVFAPHNPARCEAILQSIGRPNTETPCSQLQQVLNTADYDPQRLCEAFGYRFAGTLPAVEHACYPALGVLGNPCAPGIWYTLTVLAVLLLGVSFALRRVWILRRRRASLLKE